MRCCACAAGPQQNENIVQNLPQNRRKTCPEAPGSRQEHQQSKQAFFLQFFGAPRPKHHYDFDPFWLQNWWKMRSKTWSKNGSHPKLLFSTVFWFFRCRAHDFNRFWVPKWLPGGSRSDFFESFSRDRFSAWFLQLVWPKKRNTEKTQILETIRFP